MPELPEVETICCGLRPHLVGRKIVRAEHFRPDLRIPFPPAFSITLEEKTITTVTRRAKYLLMTLEDGTVLLVHLGMSGKMVLYPSARNQRQTHDHVLFRLDDGQEVVFNDPRRFGLMAFATTATLEGHPLLAHLGPEPLEDSFTGPLLHTLFKKRHSPVKIALMDATLVVGVGNIYACESLFRSGIAPDRKASSLSLQECTRLAGHIKTVLQEAIASGGSTLRDYVRSSGDTGYFQHHFAVYGREGEPCVTCKNPIQRMKQSGRSTFFCDTCQA